MDPYLEDDGLWPVFHHQLVMCLYQILLPGLVDRYRARVSQRHYVTEQALFTSVIREEHHEDLIEIRQRNDGRLVTLVDVVSPANKTTAAGRSAYLDKRREGKNAHANLVELDLVLQGQPTLEYSRDGLPDWDYAVTVTRSTQPERYEIYTATLQKRLPRFRLPLAADDRDTVLDLHTAFTRCYDQGGFAAKIDYRRDPNTALNSEDRQWLNEVLRQQKLR
jgi:predicted transcriptional regulator